MGFLDKAKAAAGDMMAKADTALAGAGLGGPGSAGASDSGSYVRDLGVIAYLESQGRPAPTGERDRIIAALAHLEGSGASVDLRLRTVGAPPPGTPGGVGYAPPPPGAGHVPPADHSRMPSEAPQAPPQPPQPPQYPQPHQETAPPPPSPPTAPPPPPPSWA